MAPANSHKAEATFHTLSKKVFAPQENFRLVSSYQLLQATPMLELTATDLLFNSGWTERHCPTTTIAFLTRTQIIGGFSKRGDLICDASMIQSRRREAMLQQLIWLVGQKQRQLFQGDLISPATVPWNNYYELSHQLSWITRYIRDKILIKIYFL